MQVSKNHIKSVIGKFLEILFHLSVFYFILFPLLNPENWTNSFLMYLFSGTILSFLTHPTIKKDLDVNLSIYFLIFITLVFLWGLFYIMAIMWVLLDFLLPKKHYRSIKTFEDQVKDKDIPKIESNQV